MASIAEIREARSAGINTDIKMVNIEIIIVKIIDIGVTTTVNSVLRFRTFCKIPLSKLKVIAIPPIPAIKPRGMLIRPIITPSK